MDLQSLSEPPLVSLTAVRKSYPVAASASGRLRTLVALLRGRPPYAYFDALQDVSLEIRRGESMGLIGANGAGKSTLLKIIAGVAKPSAGQLVTRGRISALLELGAGFHPEYTGRQNIFLAAALAGISEHDARERLDDILGFADIGNHIDQPIKQYSSGMVVRLGFAVATSLHPDILVTDEVLAVGDESFQRKCIAWMEDYLSNGGTLLLCSHSMFHVQKLCQKAAWIEEGRLRGVDDAHLITREYLAWHDARNAARAHPKTPVAKAGHYALLTLELNDKPAHEGILLAMGANLKITGTIHSPDGRAPTVVIGIVRMDGTPIYGVSSKMDGEALTPRTDHEYGFSVTFPELPLLPGEYTVKGHALDPEEYRLFDELTGNLTVIGESRELGVCRLPHRWNLPPLP
jgi:lipopolysaccharide transport system ATP-binding protein